MEQDSHPGMTLYIFITGVWPVCQEKTMQGGQLLIIREKEKKPDIPMRNENGLLSKTPYIKVNFIWIKS